MEASSLPYFSLDPHNNSIGQVVVILIALYYLQLPKYGSNLCPSTDESIKKMWYINTMDYYSTIKKNLNFAICSNMVGLGGHYAN